MTTQTLAAKPQPNEHAPYYGRYIALVPDGDILQTLGDQLDLLPRLVGGLSEAAANTRHAPYTWSIKEVVGHLTDSERVFGYRALRIARADETPLPGFDENAYVKQANFDALPLEGIVDEWLHLRRSHWSMFSNFPEQAWSRKGTANDTPVTVRAIAYILAGHVLHHSAILAKRLA